MDFKAARLFCFSCLLIGACDNQGPEDELKRKQAQQELALKLRAQEELSQKLAAEEKAKQEEQEAKAALLQKQVLDQMLACCEGLGKAGFEGRNMKYMEALDLCEAAHKEGKQIKDVSEQLKNTLGSLSLPKACVLP